MMNKIKFLKILLILSLVSIPFKTKSQVISDSRSISLMDYWHQNTGGYLADILVNKDIVYIAIGNNLFAYDFSDIDSTKLLSNFFVSSNISGLANIGDTLFIASAGFSVVSFKNPRSPELIGYINNGGGKAITIIDSLAFTDGYSVDIIDISESTPRKIQEFREDIKVRSEYSTEQFEDYLLIFDVNGSRIMDFTNPNLPVVKGEFLIDDTSIASKGSVNGKYAYLSIESGQYDTKSLIGFSAWDLANPEKPTMLSFLDDSKDSLSYRTYTTTNKGSIFIIGEGEVYEHYGRIRLFDFSNPQEPKELGSIDLPLIISDVEVYKDYLIAEGGVNLHVIDISNPVNPKLLYTVDTSFKNTNVKYSVVEDDIAVLALGSAGVQILDVADKKNISELSKIQVENSTGAIDVQNNVLAINDGADVKIIDISDLKSPKLNSVIINEDRSEKINQVMMQDNLLFICSGSLQVLDISNLEKPILKDSFEIKTEDHLEGQCKELLKKEDAYYLLTYEYVYEDSYVRIKVLTVNESFNLKKEFSFRDFDRHSNLVLSESNLYLMENSNRPRIYEFDVSTPQNPVELSGTPLRYEQDGFDFGVKDFASEKSHIFIANGYNSYYNKGIHVFDSDFNYLDAFYSLAGYNDIESINIVDEYLYASWGQTGFYILDISALVTSNETEGYSATAGFRLRQNYPNPFNPNTQISFHLPKFAHANLTVYNVLGRKVATIVDSQLNAGNHVFEFDGTRYASGIYFYSLQTAEFTTTKKMLLMK
ncbi:MAG: T9SS type A sorting domain-containing protein [Balneolaceae bacterium]